MVQGLPETPTSKGSLALGETTENLLSTLLSPDGNLIFGDISLSILVGGCHSC